MVSEATLLNPLLPSLYNHCLLLQAVEICFDNRPSAVEQMMLSVFFDFKYSGGRRTPLVIWLQTLFYIQPHSRGFWLYLQLTKYFSTKTARKKR